MQRHARHYSCVTEFPQYTFSECVICCCLLLLRGSDYNSLVELGARIGIKIRERDALENGASQRAKVCALHQFTYVHVCSQ